MKQRTLSIALLSLAIFVTSAAPTTAAESGSPVAMAEKLSRLRREVDDLSSTLEEKREDLKGRIRSYAGRKAEIEAEIQRANLRMAQLRESVSRRVERTEQDSAQMTVLTPVVLEAIGRVKKKVASGMPFKRDERITELDRLIRQLDDKLIHPVKAFGRLWDQVEDELRLARESGLYKQVITVEGKETIADVVRIGMLMMYFKTTDGVYGKTRYEDGEWRFVKVSGKEDVRNVAILFDSFKKQIRTGLFTLPDALPGRD